MSELIKLKKNKAIDVINRKILQNVIKQLETLYTDMLDNILKMPSTSRDKRQIAALGFALGALGTLFGGFNTYQIRAIQNALLKTTNKVNLVMDIAELNTKHIEKLEIKQDELSGLMADFLEQNPALISNQLQSVLFYTQRSYNIIDQSFKSAQLHRLSTSLLDSETTKQVFQELNTRADKESAKLLIKFPSDIYQLETSFIKNDDDSMSLIVHVPSARDKNLFNLYQHVPIPLKQSFSTNLTITPKMDTQYIAVGPGNKGYKVLSSNDLATCAKMGGYYFCKGRDVIQTDMIESCLGSLYLRDLDHVLKYCEFEIGDAKERVTPIGNNQYIVTTNKPFEASKICNDGTHTSVSINRISKIIVEEGCEVQLLANNIQPDTNIKFTPTITYKNMNWNIELLFPTHKLEDLHDTLIRLREQGTNIITAQALAHLNIKDHVTDPTLVAHPNTTLYFSISVLIVLLITIGFICYHRKINLPLLIKAAILKTSTKTPENFHGPEFKDIQRGPDQRPTLNIFNLPYPPDTINGQEMSAREYNPGVYPQASHTGIKF